MAYLVRVLDGPDFLDNIHHFRRPQNAHGPGWLVILQVYSMTYDASKTWFGKLPFGIATSISNVLSVI